MGSLLTLTSCGGGSGSAPEPIANQILNGLWSGTFTSNVSGVSIGAFIAISPTGETRYVTTEGVQGATQLSISGNNFTGAGTGYTPSGSTFLNGTTIAAISFSGIGTENTSLAGNYSVGGDNGTFTYTYDSTYDRSSSLAAVSGAWSGTFLSPGVGTVTINIGPTGIITGSDTNGCVLNGTISLINPLKNLYTASVTQTICPGSPITVTGLSFLSDSPPLTNNLLNFALSNTTGSIAGNLGR